MARNGIERLGAGGVLYNRDTTPGFFSFSVHAHPS